MASYPQGLGDMFDPVIGGEMAMEQFNQARQTDINANKKTLQDLMFNEQEQPLKLDQMRAGTRNTNATADQTELGNKFTRETWDPKVKAELSKYALQMDEDKLKTITTQLERDMMSPDPQVRAQATKMYQFTKEMTKFRTEQGIQHGNKMSEIGETGRQQRLTQAEAIKAGKFAPKGGAGSASEAAMVGKMTFDKQAGFYRARAREEQLKGTEEGQANYLYYLNEANIAVEKFERAKLLASQGNKAGNPDIEGFTDIPVMPTPQPQPFPGAQPAPPQPGASAPQAVKKAEHTLAQLQQMYPTVQVEQLKANYRKKFGVDPL
jgi:hypothetical protein